jgi:hypothetical protein
MNNLDSDPVTQQNMQKIVMLFSMHTTPPLFTLTQTKLTTFCKLAHCSQILTTGFKVTC